jgi:hypothetical protein
MKDIFHEPKTIVTTLKREFTAVSSLNVTTAFSATVACEEAVRILYQESTGSEFPYQSYPKHKPGHWVKSLGIQECYSPETEKFLEKLDGYSLDKARYSGTVPFKQHTSERAANRSRDIVSGTEQFVTETESLSKKPEVAALLKAVIEL